MFKTRGRRTTLYAGSAVRPALATATARLPWGPHSRVKAICGSSTTVKPNDAVLTLGTGPICPGVIMSVKVTQNVDAKSGISLPQTAGLVTYPWRP